MSDLPSGWQNAPLAEVTCKIGSGATPKGGHAAYVRSGTPLIRSQNVHFSGFTDDGLAYLDEQQSRMLDGVTVRANDVLLNITGASIGRVTLAPARMEGARVNQHVAIIRPSEGIEASFVASFLASPVMQQLIVAENYGVTRQALTKTMIECIRLPVPPASEQRRIVAKIDSLTGKSKRAREHLDHIPRLVEKYKSAILAMAFRGNLTRKWRQTEPARVGAPDILFKVRGERESVSKLARRKRVHASPNLRLTEGWEWISPDEIAADDDYSIAIGPFGSNLVRSDYRESGVRLVFVRDIKRGQFDDKDARYITQEKAKELHQHLVRGGDVLITKMGEPPGDTALYPAQCPPAVITADCIKLMPHRDLATGHFLVFCIRSDIVRDQITAITAGVAQQKVSLERFRQIALPIPPLPEQHEIVHRITMAFALIDQLASEANSAQKLIDHLDQSVLAKAFRGELVPQDPSDEPASVLLERIRAEGSSLPRARRAGG